MWEFLEEERNTIKAEYEKNPKSDDIESTYETANRMCGLMEVIVTLLGQTFNSVSYYRRRIVLLAIVSDKKQVKEILKDNSHVLEENKGVKLFGEKFDERVVKQLKIQKKSKEFLGITEKSARGSSSSQPFRIDPPITPIKW